ncbi:ribonuclease z [Fusarium longipes]|uniref:ribonuclease Z n=1 Tax=Fusarium longipes TaxID=694270 RepID=A0A395T8M4_9HYPO|nr:ribonuclease z [Fusarium longipes]
MSVSVEVAAAPTVDTPGTCLLVHADNRSYVFGRPEEGTQRAFQSSRIRMATTEQVFLSGSVSWQQVGGLFGYILTVGGVLEASREQEAIANEKRKEKGQKQKKSRDSVHIHGGENLNHTLATCRCVILRQPVSVKTHEHREDPRLEKIGSLDPDWKDDTLRVWKIPIKRERSSSPKKRRRSSAIAGDDSESLEPQFKESSTLSDHEYAASLIENIMFNGTLEGHGFITPLKWESVDPKDVVYTRKAGEIRFYKGPRPGDPEFPAEKLGDTVWVLARTKEHEVLRTYPNMGHRPLPPTIYSQTSMCYLVKCLPRRGKFDAQKAQQLKVPVPKYKSLIAGETVKTANGVRVTREMIVGPDCPGHGFIVADIESHDLIDSFVERPEWSHPELMANVTAMYWILGPGLAGDARIQKFVDEHPEFKHIFCAKDTCPNMIALAGPAQLQAKLRVVDPDRFSLLKFDNNVRGTLPSGERVESGRAGYKITLMPRLKLDDGVVAPFPDLLEAAKSVPDEILQLARDAREITSIPEFLRKLEEEENDIPNRDAEIIPLGTGSSMPGKYRNVSSTLIRVPGIGNYLLDVGEGTLGQIRRLFGEEETGNILKDLRCIVISHLHADHHLGTPILLKAWYEHTINDSNAKLIVSCISRYKGLLEEVSQVEDIGFHRLHFPHHDQNDKIIHGRRDEIKDDTFGLKAITRVPVSHCWLSMATELELTSGLRIAYSGDCRPSPNFARECKGAHLLIHECTFDDDMQSHAKKKMHSTMGEALDVARKMEARKTLLTHFSQRYVKADSLKEQKVNESGDVLMAFDHMRVKLGDFRKAAAFQPAIAKLLAHTEDPGDKSEVPEVEFEVPEVKPEATEDKSEAK